MSKRISRLLWTSSFLALFCAILPFPLARCAEPNANFDELISQTFTAPISSASVDSLVNQLARANALDATERALEQALALDEFPTSSAERLAACYYRLRLRAAAQVGGDAFDAYAERVLTDARRSDVCANVSIQASRNLGFYDAERAKKLYLALVAEFAGSDSPARRLAVQQILSSGLAPSAGSDAELDLTEYRDELSRDASEPLPAKSVAQSLAKLYAISNARETAFALKTPPHLFTIIPPAKSLDETLELSARYCELLNGTEFEPNAASAPFLSVRTALMKRGNRNFAVEEPEKILQLIRRFQEFDDSRLKLDYLQRCYSAYFNALLLVASRDGSDAAFERALETCAASVKDDPKYTADAAMNLARRLSRADTRYVERLIAILRSNDGSEIQEVADRVEGTLRFDKIVGENAVLEGVCENGDQITLDDYRGKAVLLAFIIPNNPTPNWLGEVYDKYHTAGLEVVLYCLDRDERVPGQNARASEYAFQMISNLRTASNPELGGRKFVDMRAYYGIDQTNSFTVLLIAPDGKVFATGRQPSDFEEPLKRLFPEAE